jgi:VRR-NUC domain
VTDLDMPYHPAIVPPITETAFLAQVLQVAEMYGWEGAHFRPALTGRGWRTPVQGSLGKGWPDLVLIRGTRLVFAELKRDGAKLSPDQDRVLELLRGLRLLLPGLGAIGPEVYVWHPADFDNIIEILR